MSINTIFNFLLGLILLVGQFLMFWWLEFMSSILMIIEGLKNADTFGIISISVSILLTLWGFWKVYDRGVNKAKHLDGKKRILGGLFTEKGVGMISAITLFGILPSFPNWILAGYWGIGYKAIYYILLPFTPYAFATLNIAYFMKFRGAKEKDIIPWLIPVVTIYTMNCILVPFGENVTILGVSLQSLYFGIFVFRFEWNDLAKLICKYVPKSMPVMVALVMVVHVYGNISVRGEVKAETVIVEHVKDTPLK